LCELPFLGHVRDVLSRGKKAFEQKFLKNSALDELHGADGAKEKDGRNLVGEGKSQQKWAINPQKT